MLLSHVDISPEQGLKRIKTGSELYTDGKTTFAEHGGCGYRSRELGGGPSSLEIRQ